ncbi:hypothetical protein GGI35DRAFT_300652 [Trichoderma velutinum]
MACQLIVWSGYRVRGDKHLLFGHLVHVLDDAASHILNRLKIALGLPARLANAVAPSLLSRLGLDASLLIALNGGSKNGLGDTLGLPAMSAVQPAPALVLLDLVSSLGLPARFSDAVTPSLVLLDFDVTLVGHSLGSVLEEGIGVFGGVEDQGGELVKALDGGQSNLVGDALVLGAGLETVDGSDSADESLSRTLNLPAGLTDAVAPRLGIGSSESCGSEEGNSGEELHVG